MNKVTTTGNVKDMALQSKMLAEGNEAIAKFETLEDCTYSYNNAETIIDSFYDREHDKAVTYIRSKSLISAKRNIFGNDSGTVPLNKLPSDLVKKWYEWLKTIEIETKSQYDFIGRLLRFANYEETSTALSGVNIIAPNEMQIRKLGAVMNKNRISKKSATYVELAKTYDALAKKCNNGNLFAKSSDVVEAYEKEMGHLIPERVERREVVVEATEEEEKHVEVLINVRKVFENEVGVCPEPNNAQVTSRTMLSFIENISREEWKSWYRKASMIFHPDKGGSAEEFAILKSFDNMYQENFNAWDRIEANKNWKDDFNSWKSEHGYEDDYVEESLVKSEHLEED